ncbi:MAG: hypothetical protein F6K50_21895 [Moorea sp. SIO3I7]|uniref:hypothetical protein n=1 Tax=Moorena sp. SIO3I8 TaxID=2607833 RepID=UPI0013C1D3F4|nr:hypothetical protein [Moorena sp. SIO3I8]NEN98071.1 hypothetical protein [Moorena sp. SIO3I7]NEO10022.1 hypothetical protein [Moorena sp. SIO3I8]
MNNSQFIDMLIKVLNAAIEQVKEVRYALGVAGIAAAAALIGIFFKGNLVTAFIAIGVLFIFMVILVIFEALPKLVEGPIKIPAIILSWFVLILFIATSIAFLSAVFVGKPKHICEIVLQTKCPSVNSSNKIEQSVRDNYDEMKYIWGLYRGINDNYEYAERVKIRGNLVGDKAEKILDKNLKKLDNGYKLILAKYYTACLSYSMASSAYGPTLNNIEIIEELKKIARQADPMCQKPFIFLEQNKGEISVEASKGNQSASKAIDWFYKNEKYEATKYYHAISLAVRHNYNDEVTKEQVIQLFKSISREYRDKNPPTLNRFLEKIIPS